MNRPIGRVLAAASFAVGISPNLVTFLSAVATTLGIVVLVTGPPSLVQGVSVALLLAFGFALDSADGQVARLTNRASKAGQWLDHVVDSAKLIAVHGSVLVFGYRFLDLPPVLLAVPLLFQVTSILTFFGGELHTLLRGPGLQKDSTGQPSRLRALALLPADYGILALSFVLLGWVPAFLIAYALLFVANTAIMALLLRKWFRALSSEGNRPPTRQA